MKWSRDRGGGLLDREGREAAAAAAAAAAVFEVGEARSRRDGRIGRNKVTRSQKLAALNRYAGGNSFEKIPEYQK